MKLYKELAWVWSLMTPPEAYQEEAETLWQILCAELGKAPENILEFGCGGGYLMNHMPSSLSACLVDLSEEMISESQVRNKEHRHLLGDMLEIDCGERFDCVLVHDAVMYLRSKTELLRLLSNCKRHVRKGGRIVLVPDAVKESFYERHFVAAAEGRRLDEDVSVRLLEWHWDPIVEDDLVQVEFSLLIREGHTVSAVHESHDMLVLGLGDWMDSFAQMGLQQEFPSTPWLCGGEFFILSVL